MPNLTPHMETLRAFAEANDGRRLPPAECAQLMAIGMSALKALNAAQFDDQARAAAMEKATQALMLADEMGVRIP